MSNNLKIKGALIDAVRLMEEEDCVDLTEYVKYKGKKYMVTIEMLPGGK